LVMGVVASNELGYINYYIELDNNACNHTN
jgi:hypothetical protein